MPFQLSAPAGRRQYQSIEIEPQLLTGERLEQIERGHLGALLE